MPVISTSGGKGTAQTTVRTAKLPGGGIKTVSITGNKAPVTVSKSVASGKSSGSGNGASATDYASQSAEQVRTRTQEAIARRYGLPGAAIIRPTEGGGTQAVDINDPTMGLNSKRGNTGTFNQPIRITPDPAKITTPQEAENAVNDKMAQSYGAATTPAVKSGYADIFNPQNIQAAATALSGGAKPPEAPSLASTYKTLQQDYGVDSLNAELNDIKAEKEQAFADLRTRTNYQKDRPVALGVIGGSISKVEQQQQERIDFLGRQEARISDQLNNAYTAIGQIMQYTQLDYQNASQLYSQKFSQNLQTIDLLRGLKNDQITQEQRAQDTARANANTIMGVFKEQGIKYSDLPEGDRTNVEGLLVQAGLPKNLYAKLDYSAPKLDVKATTDYIGADGKKYVSVILSDPKTGKITSQTFDFGNTLEGRKGNLDIQQTEQQIRKLQLENNLNDPNLDSSGSLGGIWGNAVTQGYGGTATGENAALSDLGKKGHPGIDIDGKTGDPVSSTASGKVISVGSGYNGGYGNNVVIQDANGNNHMFNHLSAAEVKIGDIIQRGQIIGLVGNTGRVEGSNGKPPTAGDTETGSHLDYRVKNSSGQWINPTQFLSSTKSAGTTADNLASGIFHYLDSTPTEKGKIFAKLSPEEKNIYTAAASGDYSAILGENSKYIESAKNLLADKAPERQTKAALDIFQKIQKGDLTGAKKLVAAQFYQNLSADDQKDVRGKAVLLDQLQKIIPLVNEAKNSGIVGGTVQELITKLGKTGDPKLRELQQRMAGAIQAYTKAQSGVAFSAQEFDRYKSIFPTEKKTAEANLQDIQILADRWGNELNFQVSTNTGGALTNYHELFQSKADEQAQAALNHLGNLTSADKFAEQAPDPEAVSVWDKYADPALDLAKKYNLF